ncbi:MAG TPA: subclass B3 metallo-beta-lactamase [Terriglobales bacterium]|nr:subclass B3 metallo-beta-lactamase [Terriglobales bacterium]
MHYLLKNNMRSGYTRYSLFALPLMFAGAAFGQQGGAPVNASDGPRMAIERYFQAHVFGNGDFIRQAFTPDAKITFIEGGEQKQWTREEFAQRFQQPADDEYRRVRRVERLDISGTAASAVLTLNYPQVLFTDHVALLKIGNEWKIVNKVFSADRRDAGQEAMKETLKDWSLPFEPRKIIGNIYYVGSNLISSFLIVTPAGNILLDTGHVEMLPQVTANIEKLGFQMKDVKVLLNSHAHFDHCGGFAELKRRTGATVVASKLDGELMQNGGKGDFFWGDELSYEPVKPDRIIADGDHVELGGVTLTAHLTPGHTKGCTSWSMQVNEANKNYNVLFLCGLTTSLYKLTNNPKYPNIVDDARSTLERLRGMHPDVLLAPHGFYFDLEEKAARQKTGAPNPFVDPGELDRHLAEMQKDFEDALQAQERQR